MLRSCLLIRGHFPLTEWPPAIGLTITLAYGTDIIETPIETISTYDIMYRLQHSNNSFLETLVNRDIFVNAANNKTP